eukprot:12634713-Heterocapsa_arctica.AAC.1
MGLRQRLWTYTCTCTHIVKLPDSRNCRQDRPNHVRSGTKPGVDKPIAGVYCYPLHLNYLAWPGCVCACLHACMHVCAYDCMLV